MTIRHGDPSDNADLFEIYRHTSVTENSSQLPYLNNTWAGVQRLATFKAGRYQDLVLMARIRPELA